MKMLKATLLAATAMAALHAGLAPAVAQDSPFIAAQTQDQYLAKDQLIGAKVHGPDGKIVGDVEDLIINESNQVIGVVMGTGGFLGLAEKKVGVPLGALTFEDKDGKTIVNLAAGTQANIAAAPAFERVKPKKTLLERAKEKVEELSDKTSTSTQEAVEKAKPALEEAKEKAVEAYEKAKEAAQPAIEKAKEAAQEATEAVKEAVGAGGEATPAPAEPAPAPAPEAAPAEPAPAPEAAPAPATDAPAAETPASP